MSSGNFGVPARILVVDDNAENRSLLEIILGSEGFGVVTAAGGEQALSLSTEAPPDLILLDLMMPGMNGLEVVERLKANFSTKLIPIVMISGVDDDKTRLKVLRAGAEALLPKPLNVAELLQLVRQLLSRCGPSLVPGFAH